MENLNDYGDGYLPTPEDRQLLEQVDTDGTLLDMFDKIEQINLRLSELNRIEQEKQKRKKPPVRELKAIADERNQLLAYRRSMRGLIETACLQAQQQLRDFRLSRQKTIANSEQLLSQLIEISNKADRAMRELVILLDQRRATLEALRPLLTEAEVERYSHRDPITQALGRAGVRNHANLMGAPESDQHTLREHDEQLVTSCVRNEVLRLKRAANQQEL